MFFMINLEREKCLAGPAGEMMLQSNISYVIDNKRNYQFRRQQQPTATRWQNGAPPSQTANETRDSVTTLFLAVLAVRAADRTQRTRLRQRFSNENNDDNETSSLLLATRLVFFLPSFATAEENQKEGHLEGV